MAFVLRGAGGAHLPLILGRAPCPIQGRQRVGVRARLLRPSRARTPRI